MWGVGCGVWVLVRGVWGLGCGVQGVERRVWGVGGSRLREALRHLLWCVGVSVDSSCRLLIVPPFRGSRLIGSHHSGGLHVSVMKRTLVMNNDDGDVQGPPSTAGSLAAPAVVCRGER